MPSGYTTPLIVVLVVVLVLESLSQRVCLGGALVYPAQVESTVLRRALGYGRAHRTEDEDDDENEDDYRGGLVHQLMLLPFFPFPATSSLVNGRRWLGLRRR